MTMKSSIDLLPLTMVICAIIHIVDAAIKLLYNVKKARISTSTLPMLTKREAWNWLIVEHVFVGI